MIRRIKLENFRRHAETEIVLDPNDQIVAVAGANGSGKSSLLEGIQFALFGQGRMGSRNLDGLIRRGAEHEGMGVELEFTVGEDVYKIIRRRDGKHVSAVLYANDQPLVEGPRAVTEAVTGLLGLDPAGFRLAAVAQQKELDALIRLGGPARVRALSRLLRLDAVSRAREGARVRHRRSMDVLSGIPTPAELSDLEAALAAARAELAGASAAEAECRAAIAELEARLTRSAEVEEVYQTARSAAAAAEATANAAAAEVARLEAQLEAIVVPEAGHAPVGDEAALAAEAAGVERAIAAAESAAQVNSQRAMLTRELAEVNTRLDSIDAVMLTRPASSILAEHDEVTAAVAVARSAAAEAHKAAEASREERVRASEAAMSARKRAEALTTLGASCDRCGQEVPEQHRHDALEEAEAAARDAESAEAAALAQVGANRDRAEEAERQVGRLTEQLSGLDAEIRAVMALEGEAAELVRRRDVYSAQLGRLVAVDVDVDALYRRKAEIALAQVALRAAERAGAERAAAIARRSEMEGALVGARLRVDTAVRAAGEAAITAELEEAWAQRRTELDAHRAELEMLGELTAARVAAQSRVAAAEEEVGRNATLAAARGAKQEEGTVAGLAVRVLTELESRLGANVRPALEGAASDLLDRLSDGRFTSVKLSAEYSPTVLDDGSYRQLVELSGGEQDLVALALRLAVSDVVAERQGGQLGFLILDEILGSQDFGRRETILATLRGLRSRYGQIWCISHVGGLEDVADRLVEIEIDENGVAHAV